MSNQLFDDNNRLVSVGDKVKVSPRDFRINCYSELKEGVYTVKKIICGIDSKDNSGLRFNSLLNNEAIYIEFEEIFGYWLPINLTKIVENL